MFGAASTPQQQPTFGGFGGINNNTNTTANAPGTPSLTLSLNNTGSTTTTPFGAGTPNSLAVPPSTPQIGAATAQSNGTPQQGGLFGGSSTAAAGGSLFGQPPSAKRPASSGAAFGGSSTNNTTPGSFALGSTNPTASTATFGASTTFGASGQQASIFGGQQQQQQAQQLQPQQQQMQSPFGGGSRMSLSHSQSVFDLRGTATTPSQQLQSYQLQQLQLQQQQQQQQQKSNLPQSTVDYLTSSPSRSIPASPSWMSGADSSGRRFVPSHIAHMRQKNAQQMHASQSSYFSPSGATTPYGSPLTTAASTPPVPPPTPLMSSGLGQSSSRLNSPLNSASRHASSSKKFGGQSFGTPKPHHLRSSVAAGSGAGGAGAGGGVGGSEVVDDLPPVESIYDSGSASSFAFQMPLNTTNSLSFGNSNNNNTSSSGNSSDYSMEISTSPSKSTMSLSSNEQQQQQPSSVMIFGFPPELTHVVVDHFSKFGTILEHLSTSSTTTSASGEAARPPAPVETGKNWIKITYTTPMAANRALMENGQMLGGRADYVLGCVAVPSAGGAPSGSSSGGSGVSGMKRSGARSGLNVLAGGGGEGAGPSTPMNYAGTISRRRGGLRDEHLFTPEMTQVKSVSGEMGMSRTTSMPAGLSAGGGGGGGAGGRKLEVKGGEGIFKEKERKPLMNMTHSVTLRGIASRFMGGEAGVAEKRASEEQGEQHQNKRVKIQAKSSAGGGSSGRSWVGALGKRASEMIFGWDEL